jgi:hypothetical protein
MIDDIETIECPTHGRSIAAVVCRHQLEVKDACVGFVENSSDADNLQAWCDACEAMFLREGELTETFRRFCDFAVVCVACYEAIKVRHARVVD